MLYDIINPSDSATFYAPDLQVAALSMFLLSNGQFGADAIDTDKENNVPTFLMGGAIEWWDARFEISIADALGQRASDVADALSSVALGDVSERVNFDSGLAAAHDGGTAEAFRHTWNDTRRKSESDFTADAAQISQTLREKYPVQATAPSTA
jgi:hypothetical protein